MITFLVFFFFALPRSVSVRFVVTEVCVCVLFGVLLVIRMNLQLV